MDVSLATVGTGDVPGSVEGSFTLTGSLAVASLATVGVAVEVPNVGAVTIMALALVGISIGLGHAPKSEVVGSVLPEAGGITPMSTDNVGEVSLQGVGPALVALMVPSVVDAVGAPMGAFEAEVCMVIEG